MHTIYLLYLMECSKYEYNLRVVSDGMFKHAYHILVVSDGMCFNVHKIYLNMNPGRSTVIVSAERRKSASASNGIGAS